MSLTIAAIAASLFKEFVLPSAIRAVEKAIGAGKGLAVKKPLVSAMVTPFVQAVAAQGVGLEQGAELDASIDAKVKEMNDLGILKGHDTEPLGPKGNLKLFAMGAELVKMSGVID